MHGTIFGLCGVRPRFSASRRVHDCGTNLADFTLPFFTSYDH